MNIYPQMTVEQRTSTTAHGLPSPTQEGTNEYKEQLNDTVHLASHNQDRNWDPEVVEILNKYYPVTIPSRNISTIISEFGYNNWKSVCDFVRDDECVEFGLKMAEYMKRKGISVKQDLDFIDGTGVGFYSGLTTKLKEILEKGFDAKYYYHINSSTQRPLEFLLDTTGSDFSCIADYVHPGHPRYPAGHSCKFYGTVEHFVEYYNITEEQKAEMIYIAYVFSMGRSGILVHLPEDNITPLASFTTLLD